MEMRHPSRLSESGKEGRKEIATSGKKEQGPTSLAQLASIEVWTWDLQAFFLKRLFVNGDRISTGRVKDQTAVSSESFKIERKHNR